MKGQEVISNIVRAEMPDISQIRDKCVRETAAQEHSTRQATRMNRPLFRTMALTAAAVAVLVCLGLFGNTFSNNRSDNAFSVIAYAYEDEENGSISLRSYEVTPEGWQSCVSTSDYYGYYRSIYFGVEGNNVENVEFIAVGDCKFKKERYLFENGKFAESNYHEYYDDDGNLTGIGCSYTKLSEEVFGNSLTLEELGELAEDEILFVGRPHNGDDFKIPLNLTIRAIATFKDGTTQEVSIIV